jgi:predicted RNase H-like nuclease
MLEAELTAYCAYAAVNDWSRSNLGCGISRQSWGIYPKVLDVDLLMRARLDTRIHEVHPELSFQVMTGSPMAYSKHLPAGRTARLEALLRSIGPQVAELTPPRGARLDDLYDALAALWTAARISRGTALRIPDPPQRDRYGLDMAIWF